MKNILKRTFLAISIGLATASAIASPLISSSTNTPNTSVVKGSSTDKNIEVIEKSIKQYLVAANPSFRLNSITAVEGVPGLYEVVHNRNNLIYITADGSHIFDGNLVSLKDMNNITGERKAEINVIKFKDLPKNPIILKQGSGVNKIAVFSDPTCTHCKSLEPELQKLKDVTISLYILPILSETSQTLAESIVCSKKPGQSWSNWMLEGKQPDDKTCTAGAKTINNNLNFAKEYEITSTPTIIFENGEVVKGSFPAAKIQDYFKVLKDKEKESSIKK